MLPDFRSSISSSGGLRSRSTRSALLSDCMRSELVFAPAASYSPSAQPTDMPSPLSVSQSAPSFTSFPTVAGETGTRASDGSASLGTNVRMIVNQLNRSADQGRIPQQQAPSGHNFAR